MVVLGASRQLCRTPAEATKDEKGWASIVCACHFPLQLPLLATKDIGTGQRGAACSQQILSALTCPDGLLEFEANASNPSPLHAQAPTASFGGGGCPSGGGPGRFSPYTSRSGILAQSRTLKVALLGERGRYDPAGRVPEVQRSNATAGGVQQSQPRQRDDHRALKTTPADPTFCLPKVDKSSLQKSLVC